MDMKSFGFLSFGHYGSPGSGHDAADMLTQAVELSVAADEIGVNGAYFRVHHFARQAASPMPLLSAIAARTKHIEVGTGVIDMRYENPLYLAEEAGALDLLSGGRVALGVSRGSPEPALRGWEAFGYDGSTDPRGADIAREKFDLFLRAVRGERLATADPAQFGPNQYLRVEPHSPGLASRIWWGAGSRDTAEWAARQGVNLMSSTLLTEATGDSFASLQAEQIARYRAAWAEAGHEWTPRVSVSRSVFPIMTDVDRQLFIREAQGRDQIGVIDGFRSTFGKSYAGEPDQLVEALLADEAVMSADTLMLTIPSQLGVDYNLHLLSAFAEHVAPELGWRPGSEGPTTGYPTDEIPG
ncbi:alkanesulfonate monooxygenase SsuD/methylene tetrahydromethanopterin reductase-like flavin-dependent oxidoreductase (luciferase family) [Corynebacterium freneyi]|uniref:Alkanesulfonate monooxygenase SsuD/methylene tetrahydromethanopterin reductase-like flavin-dependent oxidoreductase (Luciferase family) n=2 Tax=Corynebacterium freneyi TaxID=134034 RepID=A0ABS4U8E1_9CORY|nr:alkanesulfonate monooxygenase SsuD/methylene tetrahydromethanopterin reductase-like flavin-dependent oxidoreductase (luciferase family) [Corynebacterium freneyi]WJZ04973.1 Limonene 1,2-monooxygenase [Corynebacterium freneyi]